jgi:hypothetical protein
VTLHRRGSIRTWWAEGRPLLRDSWVRKDDYQLNWLGNLSNAYRHHTRWLRWSWWSYVWRAPEHWTYTNPIKRYRDWKTLNRWEVRWCRLRGHPGIIYYSSGPEPDNRCKRCKEEIA